MYISVLLFVFFSVLYMYTQFTSQTIMYGPDI